MTTDLIPRTIRTELVEEHTGAVAFLEAVEDLDVASQADLDFASELLVSVKAKHKAFEERRTAITKPILAAKREVDALFSPVLKPLETAEGILKEKVGAYAIAREQERRQLMASGETNPAALAPVELVVGVSVKELWDFEVLDAGAVPRRYLTVDRAQVLMSLGEDIPGIRFFKRGQVAVRVK